MKVVPPATMAEIAVVVELIAARSKEQRGVSGSVDDELVQKVVGDLRDGRAFVVVRHEQDVLALRRIFPRAPVVVKPGEPRPRLLEEIRRPGVPPPLCARCLALEAAEAAGTELPTTVDGGAHGGAHTMAGACRARWACDACRMVYSDDELKECSACTTPDCAGRAASFSGVIIGELV